MNFTSEVNDWNKVVTSMPPNTRPNSASYLFTILFIHTAPPTAAMAPMKANSCTMELGMSKSSARHAPKLAPADAPKISGETSGFLNMPW